MTRNSWRKFVSIVLCFSFIISLSCYFTASAAEPAIGVVTASSLNVRTSAGVKSDNYLLSNGKKVQITSGTQVKILNTVNINDTSNPVWYQIEFSYSGSTLKGYVSATYISIINEHDFTMPEGVPEEYKSYIENILKYYPDWKFVFYDTGLDWNSLFGVDQQGYVGRSLIPKSFPISYRSTASGCYNWRTDEWIMQDAGGWYQANTETIAYYMDPRNFLNIDNVFMFESLSYDKSTQTLDGVKKILQGSFMDGVKIKDTDGKSITYAEAYIKAAEITKVSPYHLASRTIQEVGKNGSKSVQGQGAEMDDNGTIKTMYKGYYNFYNIYATQGTYAIANGLRYAAGLTRKYNTETKKYEDVPLSKNTITTYNLPWNSQYKAIVGGAIWIGNGYINSVYKQNTMYFQKFNTSGAYAGHQYMGNIAAPYYESITIKNTYNTLGILDKSFTFIIPYYRNMPKDPCKLPASNNLNPNNWLKALYAYDSSGKDLVKGFDGATLKWDLGTVKTNTLELKATAVNSKAKISGSGKKTLTDGKNTFKITVTAENGDKLVYTVTANYKASTPEVTTPPTTTEPQPSVKLGDVDFDGNITISDALLIFKHKSGEKTLSESAQKAADTNKNGSVDIADALLIFKYKSGEISKF